VKLGLMMVLTPDLTEAERFYGEILGLRLADRAPNQLIFDLEGTEFHVFQCDEPAPVHAHGDRAASVCVFEVPSIDLAMRQMTQQGVVFLHKAPAQNALGGFRYAAFQAPGGNVHEIMERRPR
jgi:catechol 2,3-dioxygenase-like lactoylglutathione lyase family enzyme